MTDRFVFLGALALGMKVSTVFAQGAPPAMPTSPSAASVNVQVQSVFNPQAGIEAKKDVEFTSLMFTPDQLAQIEAALIAFSRQEALPSSTTPTQVQDVAAAPKVYYEYPQFFLDSIIYHGPEDWVVWLNGVRFTPDSPTDFAMALTLSGVTPASADFTWTPTAEDRQYIAKFMEEPLNEIEFTLYPNQTYASYGLKVLEGKVQPVRVQITGSGAAAPASPSAPGIPLSSPAQQQGLGGLIQSYDKLEKNR